MSDELDEGDESVEENKTHYTAISNTPTRITFLSNTQNKYKTKKASTKVQKRKVRDFYYFEIKFNFFVVVFVINNIFSN